MAAAQLSGKRAVPRRYPITPASDILHELAELQELRRAARSRPKTRSPPSPSAIGAAFGGAMAVTATSGPGIALKGEGMGLAVMTELPLLIINVQRGGPSTGPADQDRAGRPVPGHVRPQRRVPAAGHRGPQPGRLLRRGPGGLADRRPLHDAGDAAHRRLHRQRLRAVADSRRRRRCRRSRSSIPAGRTTATTFLPYKRDERLARPWAIPGTPGLMHRIGGLEKQDITGNVNYEPDNHEHMVNTRAQKVGQHRRRHPAAGGRRPGQRRPARRSAGAAPTAPAPRPCEACQRAGPAGRPLPPALPEPVPARTWATSSSATRRC